MKFSLASLAILSAAYAAPAPDNNFTAVVEAVGNMTNNLIGHTQQLAHMGGVQLDDIINVPGIVITSEDSTIVARDWTDYLPLAKNIGKDLLGGLSTVLALTGFGPAAAVVSGIGSIL